MSEENFPFLSRQGGHHDDCDDEFVAPRPTGGGEGDGFAGKDNDKAWAIAFKVNMAIVLVSAMWFGRTGCKSFANADMFDDRRLSASGSGGPGDWIVPMLVAVGVVGIAWAFAWGLLLTLVNCSKLILQAAYLGSTAVTVSVTVSAIAAGQFVLAIFPAVMSAVFIVYFIRRQSRIRFGGANLKVAALAIKSMPSTIRFALLMSGVQVLWCILVGVAASGSMTAFETVEAPNGSSYRAVDCFNVRTDGSRSCQCEGDVIVYNSSCVYGGQSLFLKLFWLASFVWGGAVFQNVVAATVAGSVASWWFSPNDSRPVQGAFYRASHSSFGSLCKAAAVTGVIRMVRKMALRLAKWNSWFRTLWLAVQAAVDYVMAYTICYIGIYGFNFSQAGSRVGELFRKRGVTTFANDTVVEVGLYMLASAASVGYIAAAMVVIVPLIAIGGWGFFWFAILGYLACVFVVSTTLEVLRSGFKAVFVCFVQDPEALAANHDRRLHDELARAWEEMRLLNPTAVGDPNVIQQA